MVKTPIIIVPGCYGSKINVIHPENGQKIRAWFCQKFHPKIMQGEAAINYLWGYYDQDTFKSYIEEYAKVEVETGKFGFDGCDRFYESSVLEFLNGYFLAYMAPLVNYLRKELDYTLGTDLFCFTYDWRQSAFNEEIQSSFTKYLQAVKEQTGKSAILITHSAGLVYIKGLMRLVPNWNDYFHKIISINSAIDGAGALSAAVAIAGYNLAMPIAHIAMKFSCVSSQIAQNCQPVNEFIKQTSFCTSVFVRKLVNQKRITPLLFSTGSKYQQKYQQFDQKSYKLKMKALPNAAEMLLNLVLKDKAVVNRAGCIKLLSQCARRECLGQDLIRDFEVAGKMKSCEQMLVPEYQSEDALPNQAELNSGAWTWEEFAPCNRNYQHADCELLKLQKVKDETMIEWIDPKHKDKIVHGFEAICFSQDGEDLYKIAQARTVYQEVTHPVTSLQCKVMDTAPNFAGAERTPHNSDEPTAIQEQATPKPVDRDHKPWLNKSRARQENLELYKGAYTTHTFDTKFFGTSASQYRKYMAFTGQKMHEPTREFKHVSIVSCGQKTPVHAVFEKPVADYQELLIQQPTYVFADGDGLVPLYSLLTPSFDKKHRGGVYVVPGVGHFPAVQDDRVFKIVKGAILE
ncbi:Lecithin-cholesterol_acyltransferase [Hexamita inflata]|uniref:Lecithin-cholesterol acyltransferase n=1 Tax=Hexamita inflata TaxID=28002 RepID=A0AA86Q372_9EUKA|nr:Lecithin-cholesterol acyltransferase [Hexamita inflata]